MSNFEYLLSPINTVNGVGKKTAGLLNRKRIFTIFDLLWHLPLSKIETSEDTEIENIQIGKLYNIKVVPIKYNFPRIRNLPNKVTVFFPTPLIVLIGDNKYSKLLIKYIYIYMIIKNEFK